MARNGKPKPSLFSHVATRGCSVQRADQATADEMAGFVTNFLTAQSNGAWLGVVSAQCGRVRKLVIEEKQGKLFCVYDTAEAQNPSHAEIFQTKYAVDEGNENEIRRILMDLFHSERPVDPSTYESGAIWKRLSEEHRARK